MPMQCCIDKFPQIPAEEPVFILRGKDRLAILAVKYWITLAEEAGVNKGKMIRVKEHLDAMINFKNKYPERMKTPD